MKNNLPCKQGLRLTPDFRTGSISSGEDISFLFNQSIARRLAPIHLLLISLLSIFGCGSGKGADSLPLRGLSNGSLNCASQCHSATSTASPDPLTTNGIGAAGKHRTHVAVRSFGCGECHFEYQQAATHMNGHLDTPDFSVNIVSFDTNTNPGGVWSNDAGPQTGACSSLVCHGPNALNWYGAGGTITNCTVACHAPDSVVSPDPLQTNGAGSAGKHVAHVQNRGISCQTCHSNYTNQYTHSNGQLDTGNSSVFLVSFDATNPSALWSNDTGTGTGSCSATACHGADVLNWYQPGGQSSGNCTATCHSPGSTDGSPDPMTTNGSGAAGKHSRHVTTNGFTCTKCHRDYMHQATHINGQLDTGTASVSIVQFDSTNPAGQWVNDSGVSTGSCSNLACHGASVLDWYGVGAWALPDCAVCHSSPLNARRAIQGLSGDFNKQSHHVIDYANRTTEIVTSNDCRVCHAMDTHMSGSIRLNDKDNAGQVITYVPGSAASLEPFCLSCHDLDGATESGSSIFAPFTGGNSLGLVSNVAGTSIRPSWEKQNGHRRQGLTCLGSGTAGTGCHGNYNTATQTGSINAHGSDNPGLLTNKYTLPIPDETWDSTRYKLCLDCHDYYPAMHTISQIVGVAPGGNYAQSQPFYVQWPYAIDFMATGFHDYLGYTFDRQFNLHLYHMTTSSAMWNYRGGPSSGVATCVACHNVHGVNGQYYYLWDEWNYSIVNEAGTEYGKLQNAAFGGSRYPESCSFNCHWDGNYRYPRSPFNEAKAAANNTSGVPGLQNGDTVVISFSDSTNAPAITNANISTVLALSGGHTWIGTDGSVTAAWSSANGKTNNVLTITLNIVTGNPTIAVGDGITFDLVTITDTNGTPVRGRMTLMGNF